MHSFHGIFIVTALAESNEGRVRIFELWLSAFKPEIPPFLLKVINIIAGRYDPGVIVGFKIKRRKQRRFRAAVVAEHAFGVDSMSAVHVQLCVAAAAKWLELASHRYVCGAPEDASTVSLGMQCITLLTSVPSPAPPEGPERPAPRYGWER